MKLSIAICTYNRSSLLESSLLSLENQSYPLENFEVIIINNNSTDDTSKVAKKFCDRNVTWRCIFEKKQGLSHARNRAIKESQGSYIGYLDDDGKANSEWVETAIEIIKSREPAVFGGPYYPFYNSSKPEWWKDEYRSFEPVEKARILKEKEYLSGGNIFFRKKILKELGRFRTDLGMRGEQIATGEETELQIRFRKKFPEEIIYCDPKLYIYHLVHEKKMKLTWLIKKKYLGGKSAGKVFPDNTTKFFIGGRSILISLYYGMKLFYSISLGAFFRKRRLYPKYQNYFYEVVLNHIKNIGFEVGRLKKAFL